MNQRYLTGFVALLAGVALQSLGRQAARRKTRTFLRFVHIQFCLDIGYILPSISCGIIGVLDIWYGREVVVLFPSIDSTQYQLC